MITSMTGFANRNVILELSKDYKVTISISLKSLNSRFFETTCKLPFALSHLETDFIKLFKTKLYRGHIYFTIHISSPNVLKSSVEPSLPIVKAYINAVNQIQKKFDLEGSLSLHDLLQLPNIFNVEEQTLDNASTKLLFDITNQLIEELITARKKEGAELKKDLVIRIKNMGKEIKTIEKASNILMKQQKEKISNELKDFEEVEPEGSELRRQMLYAALDKIDIHEEIVRFTSHLKNLSEQLDAPGVEKGKRLDFTLQELSREINTIAAKCSDVAIGSLAINIKVELEKTREQVQNIV